MEITNYVSQAMRTAKALPTLDEDMDHAYLGMITELGELATTIKRAVIYAKGFTPDLIDNIDEESGDFLWYWALAVDRFGIDFAPGLQNYPNLAGQPVTLSLLGEVIDPNETGDPVEVIKGLSILVADLQQGNAHPTIILGSMAVCLLLLLRGFGLDINQAAERNIAKLRARFPDAYSDQAAEARADKGGVDARNS